jgi:hypothetical protein
MLTLHSRPQSKFLREQFGAVTGGVAATRHSRAFMRPTGVLRNPAGHSRSSRSHDHARCRRSVGGSFLGSRTRTIDPSATFILQIAPPESRRAIPIQVCLSLALTKQPPGRQSARRRAPARPGHDAKLPSTTPMAPLRGNHAALNDQPPASRSPRYSAMVRSRPVPQHIMCMSNKAA